MLNGMNRRGLALVAPVAVVALAGIALAAKSLDGPVEPANPAAVVKARKNYLRLARGYRVSYRHYESRKRWDRQMNRVCHLLQRRERVLDWRLRRAGRLQSAVALLRAGEGEINAALGRMRRLRPPPEDRARVRRMFVGYDRTMALFDPLLNALAARDFGAVQRIGAEAARASKRADRIASALGANVCTQKNP
jgi:hypothetical protein